MSQRICTNVLNSVVLYFRQSYSSHVSVANVLADAAWQPNTFLQQFSFICTYYDAKSIFK